MEPINVMLDSGAVNFYNRVVSKKSGRGFPGRYFKDRVREDHSYVETEEFISYRDAYVRFLKKNKKHVTTYVNLDIINNAEASYESLKWLEAKGLHPLPVFHIGNDTRWLKRYIEEGYETICVGGIAPNSWKAVWPILDRIWTDILTDSNGMPVVKAHGLAVASYNLMSSFPWASCDSTSWLKLGVFGAIFMPYRRDGKFIMNKSPYHFAASVHRTKGGIEDENLFPIEKKKSRRVPDDVRDWLREIDVPVGSVDEKGDMVEWGIVSNWEARSLANLRYFKRFVDSLPAWPWAYKPEKRRSIFA
jgi:hypothetical protein